MKRTTLLLLLSFISLTEPLRAAAAVPPGSGELILRAGGLLHTGDPAREVPGVALSLGADRLSGRFLLGGGVDLENGEHPVRTATVRGGVYGRAHLLTLSLYLTGRYRWDEAGRDVLLGAGATADVRLAGPLGAFAAMEIAKPVVRCGYYSYMPYYGQGILSFGLTLKF